MDVCESSRTGMLCAAAVAVLALSGCSDASAGMDQLEPTAERASSVDATTFPAHYARQWMTSLANSVRFDGISPPVAARTYAYAGVAIYESVVHGMPGYRSLAGQLNGLNTLPKPTPGLEYDWPTVLAQTMDRMVRNGRVHVFPNRVFYEYTTETQAPLFVLGPIQIGYRRTAGVPSDVIEDSIAYGNALADVLIPWSEDDQYHALRYAGFIPPQGPQYWAPTGFQDKDKVMNPLEPHFGRLRPMVLTNGAECAPPPPVPFSTDPSSAFHAQAAAVYDAETNGTDEQREIANFWADGPGATPTPAGHWLAIATSFVRPRSLAEAASAYAITGIGYFDAFIAVWQSKYEHNLIRPETYIRRHIDSDWRPFIPTPQFPEYVSGHSGQSAASAVLFTHVFGSGPFTDSTKLRRGFGPRSFANFTAAAQEAANSRLYGGIHFPMGNQQGLALGTCVGNKIKDRVQLTL
jgi:hypothetical protein